MTIERDTGNIPSSNEVKFSPQPFDSTGGDPVDVSEAILATEGFKSLVDDMLIGHDDAVKSSERKYDSGLRLANILRLTHTDSDGRKVKIMVHTWHGDDSLPDSTAIYVWELDEDGYHGAESRYYLDHEGYVRRDDRDTGSEERMSVTDVLQSVRTQEEGQEGQRPLSAKEIAEESLKAKQFERKMGYNDQRVGREEIAMLRDLLSAAEPVSQS